MWNEKRKLKNSIAELRLLAKSQIKERIAAIKNDQWLPNDILSSILKEQGVK